MRKLSVLGLIMFMALSFVPLAVGSGPSSEEVLTLTQLVDNIAKHEKQDIVLTGTVLGACGSGCKMWVGDKDYKEGDPVALVWAKDSAFKFKTDAVGQKVMLKGFAIAKYINLCATEQKEQEKKEAKVAADQPEKGKKDCDPPIKVGANEEGARQLKSITFIATSVEYLKP